LLALDGILGVNHGPGWFWMARGLDILLALRGRGFLLGFGRCRFLQVGSCFIARRGRTRLVSGSTDV